MPTCPSLPICIFSLDQKDNPSPNPKDIMGLIASHLMRATSELVRFVNIQSIDETASPHEDARIFRGIINLFIPENPEKKGGVYVPWLWEATGYPVTQGTYHWDTVVLHTHTKENGFFDKDRLSRRLAMKADRDKDLTLIEKVVLFMIGCLTHFVSRNAELIRNGVESTETKHAEVAPRAAYVYKQCPICMLPPPP